MTAPFFMVETISRVASRGAERQVDPIDVEPVLLCPTLGGRAAGLETEKEHAREVQTGKRGGCRSSRLRYRVTRKSGGILRGRGQRHARQKHRGNKQPEG